MNANTEYKAPPPVTLEDVVLELRHLNDSMFLLKSYVEAQFEASKSQEESWRTLADQAKQSHTELKAINEGIGKAVSLATIEIARNKQHEASVNSYNLHTRIAKGVASVVLGFFALGWLSSFDDLRSAFVFIPAFLLGFSALSLYRAIRSTPPLKYS